MTGAFVQAFSNSGDPDVVTTGKKNGKLVDGQVVTPEFYDSDGTPISSHSSLNDALQAGEDAARAAAAASGTNNEYGVATITGPMVDGVQTYLNSAPVTSNSPDGINWKVGALSAANKLVALNHLHPNNLGKV